MSYDCFSKKRKGTSSTPTQKREQFRSKIRKQHVNDILTEKRRQLLESATQTSQSLQLRPERIAEGFQEEKNRIVQNNIFSHQASGNPKNDRLSSSLFIKNQPESKFSQLGTEIKHNQSRWSKMEIQNSQNQPLINPQKNSQIENYTHYQKSSIFNRKQPQIQSNRNNHQIFPNQFTNPNEITFSQGLENSPNSSNQYQFFNSPIQNLTVNNNLFRNSPQHNLPIVNQYFQVQPQIRSYNSPQFGNLAQNNDLNASFINQSPPSSNFLGINFVNILSNDRILQNPYQQNQYLKVMEINKRNFALNYASPEPQHFIGVNQSPEYMRQMNAEILFPANGYPLLPTKQLPLANQKRKIVNDFEPIKQIKRKQQPQKKQFKQSANPIFINKENYQQKILKNNKAFQPNNIQQNAIQSNLIHKYANWGKIIKKYSKFYVFDKVLGKGAYGSVYLGVNIENDQKVAVKKITVKKSKHLIEVHCLKQINHENIVTLYDFFHDQKERSCYLFLEFCQENLREKLDNLNGQFRSKLDIIKMKINFIQQLIKGMNELNQKGFIHRDLKFQNVLIKNDVNIKICDFGLCRKVNKKLQVESVRCGTPYTMAPEIFFHPKNILENPIYTEKADIFSLAVIIHQILYDIHPFDYNQDKLKKLEIFQRKKTKQISKKINQDYKINVEWIEKIIEGGLKKLQNRISWEQFMKIYQNRNQSVIQNNEYDQQKVEIKMDFLKKRNPQIQNQQIFFRRNSVIRKIQAKPIKMNIDLSKYPKSNKNIKILNPQQKQFNYIEEAQKIFTKSIKNQQIPIEIKNDVQMLKKSKNSSKNNQSKKNIQFNFALIKKPIEIKAFAKNQKKEEVLKVISSAVEKQNQKIIVVDNPILETNTQKAVKISRNYQGTKFIIIGITLNILLVMGLFSFI